MRVGVGHRLMPMGMGMGFARRVVWPVRMLMMRVMDVPVGVLQCLVNMLVRMAFGKMKPCANRHEKSGQNE